MNLCPNCGHGLPGPFVLPQGVTDAVRHAFGPGSRTFSTIGRRVEHAFRVWEEKYGPWTPAQAKYATDLCVAAVAREPNSRALVYSRLDSIVHHETVDAGFKRRAGAATLDLNSELDQLAV